MKFYLLSLFKREILGLVFILLTSAVFGQVLMTGKVTNENGESLPGVTIQVKNTATGTVTGLNGHYSLKVKVGSELVFSFVGYRTQTIVVGQQKTINIAMKPAAVGLKGLIVIGYSERKKATLTGAVSIVNMADLEKARIQNVAQALQGQVAGVLVTTSTGAPGDPVQIRIRGDGTIGNNNPLYIVDGTPTRNITFLNPANIKSMTILKDAAAAAIYGSRASNGVILITTKRGVKGKVSFDVNFYAGLATVSYLPKLLNGKQYMAAVTTAWNNSDRTGTNPYTAGIGQNGFTLANTNWLHELFTIGKSNNLQFSASGGSAKTQFLISLNYYHNNGIVIFNNDQYNRFDYRTNINADLTDRFKVGTNLVLSSSTQDALSSSGDEPGVIRHALIRPPVIAVYKNVNDPTYSKNDPFTDMPFFISPGYDVGLERGLYEMSQNPIAIAYFTDDTRKIYRTFGNVYGEYSFLKDKELTFRTNLGIDLSFFHNKAFDQNYGDPDGGGSAIDKGLGRENRPSSLNESRGEAFTYTFNNVLNYVKNFNAKNYFHALIGTEYINNYESSIGASRERYAFSNEAFRYLDYGRSDLDLWNSGTASEYALMSYFGSVTYVFNNKYMVTANFRADASSRFAEKNRWGYFPSISAGWRISNEKFLRDIKWLSYLKLRGSWGKVGNQEIPDYAYLTLISQVGGKVVINRFGNPNLKWETTTQSNIGIDIGLFNNKVAMSAEYFWKNTKGILLPISMPSAVGNVQPTIVNAGVVNNKGFEFTLNYKNFNHKFKYSINANLATLKNNVVKLYPNLPVIIGAQGVSRTVVGQPINSYYGYKMIGIYQTQAEINSYLHGTVNPSVKPGDIKFADLNGDGIINSKDREFLGKSIPDLTYGFTFTGAYKGFDISMLLQGVEGVDRYNGGKKIVDYDTRPFNYTLARVSGAWHGPGTSNTIPRMTFEDMGGSKVSSVFVENASYLRLKNVEIGYTLNLKFLKVVKDVRFYISGQNLITVTKYTGLDPETTGLVDAGTYPSARVFLLGANVEF